MKLFSRLSALIAIALLITACVKPIYNVQNHPISSQAQENLSLNDIKDVILTSALDRGWEIKKVDDNDIFITYARRNFTASAKITYTDSNYSIRYDSSTNLKYQNGKIHRNYNNWIMKLENDIARNLDKLAYNLN